MKEHLKIIDLLMEELTPFEADAAEAILSK